MPHKLWPGRAAAFSHRDSPHATASKCLRCAIYGFGHAFLRILGETLGDHKLFQRHLSECWGQSDRLSGVGEVLSDLGIIHLLSLFSQELMHPLDRPPVLLDSHAPLEKKGEKKKRLANRPAA